MSIVKERIIRCVVPVLAIIVLFWGFFLRFEAISGHSYWMDEGYTVNAVLSYATGKVSGISAVLDSGSKYECFLYCFPTALIVNQFGFDESSYRILSAIFGFLTIFAIYFVVRELFDRRIALLSAFFINFAYFQIAWSAQARWYTMFSFFFWIAIWFFIRATKNTEKNNAWKIIFWSVLTIITTILAIMSQKIGVLLPLFFAGYLVFESFRKDSKNKIITIIIAAILILGGIAVDILSGRNLIQNFFQKTTLHYSLSYYLSFFWREYLIFIPLIIWALVDNENRHVHRNSWLLISVFLIYLIPLAFFTNIVHYRYLFHVTPVFFVLGSVGFFQIWDKINNWAQKSSRKIGHKLISGSVLIIFIVLFFVTGAGIFLPQEKYFLEADDPAEIGPRPSYAYTPQPDWNAAYEFIRENRTENDLVISSHTHFNKIFLGEAGYWMKFDYLGLDDKPSAVKNDREYYVGAKVIDDLAELKEIVAGQRGFIVFDYMAIDGKLPFEMVDYIDRNFELVFHKKDNSYSEVWVFGF